MKRSKVRRFVLTLTCLCSVFTYEAGVAKLPQDGGPGEGGGGGGGGIQGGRWYSFGSIVEMKYCMTYEQSFVFFPPPPHYEVRIVQTQKDVWYLLERCSPDNLVRECTVGTQRRTYQGGGC